MPYLDVYPNPNNASAKQLPYLVEIQAGLLGNLPTTVVVPLGLPGVVEHTPVLHLNPFVEFDGTKYILMTQELSAILRRQLKPCLGNIASHRSDILAALDFLFTGY
jgi:toxin CcdB